MTIINISDITKDIDDIEELIPLHNTIRYYPLSLCDISAKQFSKTKDRQSKNLEHLIRSNLFLPDKFFSARNENILYMLYDYNTFCEINFTIVQDGAIKFINDTEECFFHTRGGLTIEHKGKEYIDRYNMYLITLVNEQVHYASTETVLEVAEFVITEKNNTRIVG